MPTRFSAASGNWTDALTWRAASAVAGAEVDSEASTFNVSSANSDSASFTLENAAIDPTKTVRSVMVKVASVVTPTGTLTVTLRNTTLGADEGSVTLDLTALPANAQGWIGFRFTVNVVPNGTSAYVLRLSRSVADTTNNRLTLYASSAAASAMSRMVILDTTGAPAAGEKVVVAGAVAGLGAGTPRTVTVDHTATTTFGSTAPPQALSVNHLGVLAFGTAASANYYLRVRGTVGVFAGGTLSLGTAAARVPATSTAVLEFDSSANADSGLAVYQGGVFNAHGAEKYPATAVTGATNASPIALASAGHGLSVGERVHVGGVGGNAAANGTWEVRSVPDANTFTLGQINGGPGGLGVGTSTGSGAYTSGGTWRRLPYTRLTANATGTAVFIGLLSTAGISPGDELAFSSTTRTSTEAEKKTVATVDSATQVTLSAGLTSGHSGTEPTRAEVGNLTRNVKVRGISATLQGYVRFETTSVVNCDHAEFSQLGSGTLNRRGVDVQTTTGSCVITYCTVRDSTVVSSTGFFVSGSAANNITIGRCIVYNCASIHFNVSATSGTGWVCDGNLFNRGTDGVSQVNLSDVGGTFTNNTITGGTTIALTVGDLGSPVGLISGNTIHSCGGIGFNNASSPQGTVSNLSVWRCGGNGFTLSGQGPLAFDNFSLFGNTTINLNVTGSNYTFRNGSISGDSSFSTATGAGSSSSSICSANLLFEDCTFGVVSGTRTAHTAGDLGATGTAVFVGFTLVNCLLASSTELASPGNLGAGGYVRSQRHDQTQGLHRAWGRYGTVTTDSVIFDAAAPSVRLTPSDAANKLAADLGAADGKGSFRAAVGGGETVTVSVRVRRSVAGDGTAYNGAPPRLVMRRAPAAGLPSDYLLAEGAGPAGAWETLTGTSPAVTDKAVLSFVVEVDGTQGWVNVDGWSAAGGAATGGAEFWEAGAPYAVAESGGGGGGGGGLPMVGHGSPLIRHVGRSG